MFEELLAAIGTSLSAHDISYMVIGGQAVLLHGEPRLTQDIDITMGVPPSRLSDVLSVAAEVGLNPLVEPESFVHETLVLPCEHDPTGIRVDFIFSFSAYEKEAMKRALGISLNETIVQFASAEDLIIHKMIAGRPRDIEDVTGILIKQLALDLSYIEKWLMRFSDVVDRPLKDEFKSLLDGLK